MKQTIFILYDFQTEHIADKICERVGEIEKIYSDNLELTARIITQMASSCIGQYFYVIKTDKEILFPSFDFYYRPEESEDYVHIWDNDSTVRLYNTDAVLENPTEFCDKELENGNIRLRIHTEKIYTYPVFDIVFLSYDEEYAEANYEKLKERFPRTKRLHNEKGILRAHKLAARLAETEMFYVVDADAQILSTFKFDFQPHPLEDTFVHVWHSHNPVNDLEYGYGGVKLFPTKALKTYLGSPIDFTTTVSKSLKVIPEVSNITKFNTDPFSAWRSGFRECVKLASKIIPNQDNTETEHRLAVWCTKGEDREFGDFAIMGAIDGAEFGKAHKDQPEKLRLINDFEWLEKRFSA